jgi:hypothetical protein
MSALPPKADIDERNWDVRFVPEADIGDPFCVLLVGNFLQPIDRLVIEPFLNGNMGHGRLVSHHASASHRVKTKQYLRVGFLRWARALAASNRIGGSLN